ncbi:unnamed protein product [Mytilus coruscus]|uniref:Uncharacterized protein n=1 Tax=Mytilus coruscus TaxID=42192 RepID=A0A6J8BAV7_MYTCO|nr:unnamed protein product [Mytilus coruscus]
MFKTHYNSKRNVDIEYVIGDYNGKRIGIVEGQQSSSWLSGGRWKFKDFNLDHTHFDADTKQYIEEMCFDATETLNSKPIGRCYGLFTQRKEYVLLYLRNKFSQFAKNHEAFEEWADKLIECTIAYYSHDIIHWENLPKSSYNRHDTWKQRECICQLVEPHLGELSLGQNVWFKYLNKREHKAFSNGTITYGRTIIL